MRGPVKEAVADEPRVFRSRTIAWIGAINEGNGGKVVRAVVPGWDLEQVMEFPLSSVPEELRDQLKPDANILVKVNLAAEKPEDLAPAEFELAPPPIDESEL